MKHAYLIIAHHEFEVLRYLVSALDDERNDIFIHFDKKVSKLPELATSKSSLYIMDKRNDVRWGHYSQIKTTLDILCYAQQLGEYSFYHVLSGTHLPLKSQDTIYHFFEQHPGKSFFMAMPTSAEEIDLKIRRYNFFLRNFMHRHSVVQRLDQLAWQGVIKSQKLLNIRKNKKTTFVKASSWFSLSDRAVHYLKAQADVIQKKYQYTLCGDEFFAFSELSGSRLQHTLVDYQDMLKVEFSGINPRIYTNDHYTELVRSPHLFARKFSKKDLTVVRNIVLSNQH